MALSALADKARQPTDADSSCWRSWPAARWRRRNSPALITAIVLSPLPSLRHAPR